MIFTNFDIAGLHSGILEWDSLMVLGQDGSRSHNYKTGKILVIRRLEWD